MSASVQEQMLASRVTLRAALPSDASVAGSICYEAFKSIAARHGFPPDFPSAASAIDLVATLIGTPHVYGVVAERGGRVVASNFLWELASVAGIGPLTVAPCEQNAKIGWQLMYDVIERADRLGFAGVRLVQAAYHQRSLALCAKLDFEVREPLLTMRGSPLGLRLAGHDVRAAREADLQACNVLCRRIHGYDRGRELADAIAKTTASVVERSGRVTGYATAIGFFSHAVAETDEDLKALIGAANGFEGPGFLLPTRSSHLVRWGLRQGLRIVQPMSLMTRGMYREPSGAYLPSILF